MYHNTTTISSLSLYKPDPLFDAVGFRAKRRNCERRSALNHIRRRAWFISHKVNTMSPFSNAPPTHSAKA